MLLLYLMTNANNQAVPITESEFMTYARNGDFDSNIAIIIEDERMIGTLKKGIQPSANNSTNRVMTIISRETKADIVENLRTIEKDIKWTESPGSSVMLTLAVTWGPVILIAFLLYFFVFRSCQAYHRG